MLEGRQLLLCALVILKRSSPFFQVYLGVENGGGRMAYKAVGEWGTWECLGAQVAQELHAAGLLMRLGVSLRDAMCEAITRSLEDQVPVKLWKVPAGMDPLRMTEAQIREVIASGVVTWVQKPCETGFLLFQRRNDPRYVYMTDILLGTFGEINFHSVVEQLDSYDLVPVGVFHTHDITQTPHYTHVYPSVPDLKSALKMELKISIIGELLGERSHVLFLFPKYAKAWKAILESSIPAILNQDCLYTALTSLFDVTEEETPLKTVCAMCSRAQQKDSLGTLLTPYLHMLRAELPSLRTLWTNGPIDEMVEVS